MASQHVIIIGAGIVGSSIAHRISRTGAKVTVIDALEGPGRGLSSASFGWITCAAGSPDLPEPEYRQRLDGIASYGELDREFGGRLCAPSNGALVWGADEAETRDWASRHAAMGSPVRLLDRSEIAALEPMLAEPPALAAHFSREKAVDVRDACEVLLQSARHNGATTLFGQTVLGLDVAGGRIAGVRLSGQTIAADRVIVAAGAASAGIVGDVMPGHGIHTSPAALITLSVEGRRLGHILDGGGLEIRSRRNGEVIAASGVDAGRDNQTKAELGREVLERVRRIYPGLSNPRVERVEIADRPFIGEGRPLVSTTPDASGLYLAVAHPGVILAPQISALVAGMLEQ